MARTSIKDRRTNARQWYQRFVNGYDTKNAIVIKRSKSTVNPNINRTQFYSCNTYGTPIVIAESETFGIEGCFIELIEFIKGGIRQKTWFEDGFKEWLEETTGLIITYNDGLVIMLEREQE